jgi:riboflavin synthase alpha subunit
MQSINNITYYTVMNFNDSSPICTKLTIKNNSDLPTEYPKIGESVYINGIFYTVVNVIKSKNEKKIIMHAGKRYRLQ